MATHDYVISNASGAAVRADLNNALAAIATNNSSAIEPTTTYAYQWWADTGSSPTVMKLRNAANSAWVTLFQLDGEWSVIPFENGTAAAPSIYFKDSGTDTGIYSPGADQVSITTGGTQRLNVDATGALRLLNSPGIDFSGIQTNAAGATSEILDSYEEGTYTVQLFDAPTGGNASATTATGYYTKVGRLVTASISINNFSTAGMTAVNALHFSLPFTSAALAVSTGSVMTGFATIGANGIVSYVSANVSRTSLYEYVSGAAFTQLRVSDFTSGTADIISTVTYTAA
jgi:hypothetical protein